MTSSQPLESESSPEKICQTGPDARVVAPEILRTCWFLVGPTASGKTAAALLLAQQFSVPAEIIALDSMTVYRGMDIGTAKPTIAEQAVVPHHLLDVCHPWESFSTAEYLQCVAWAVADIVSRGRTPFFVGGTGLYLHALLRGLCDAPAADWELRRTLQAECDALGQVALHQRLAAVDPLTAARLPAADVRRVIRALEVFQLTGQPLSAQQQERALPEDERPQHLYWLCPPRAELCTRINQRVDEMLAAGFVSEVQRLRDDPRGVSHSAAQALGYREIGMHLEGRCSLNAAAEEIRLRTRQFAKRQQTWFRKLFECRAIELAGGESAAAIAARILTTATQNSP